MKQAGSRRLLGPVLMVTGILGILDTLILLVYSNANLGVIAPGLVGCLLVLEGGARHYLGKSLFSVRHPLIRRILLAAMGLWLVSFLLLEGMIISEVRSGEKVDAQYLIILGAGLRGQNLSLTLAARMNKALEYLQDHPDTRIIISGGKGRGEQLSEAEAMKRYLIHNGIDEDRIIKEEQSTSTIENLRFSREIINREQEGFEARVIIITSDFHMFRAKMLARRAGLKPDGLPSKTPWSVLPNCYIREYFALIKSFFLDR